jgi:hypothetical protein
MKPNTVSAVLAHLSTHIGTKRAVCVKCRRVTEVPSNVFVSRITCGKPDGEGGICGGKLELTGVQN